jgi:hypothetical protein
MTIINKMRSDFTLYQRVYHRVYQPPASVGQAMCVVAVCVCCLPAAACGCQGLIARCSMTPGNLRSVFSRGSLSVAPPAMGGRFPSSLHRKLPGLRPGTPRTALPAVHLNASINSLNNSSWFASQFAQRTQAASHPCFCRCRLFCF